MKALIDRSAEAGVESICIGMPHRGACPASVLEHAMRWAQEFSLVVGCSNASANAAVLLKDIAKMQLLVTLAFISVVLQARLAFFTMLVTFRAMYRVYKCCAAGTPGPVHNASHF